MGLSIAVKTEIAAFLKLNWASLQEDAQEYDGLDITFAVDDDGSVWNYQTGDNSFTGGCYSLPHWAVATISRGEGVKGVIDEIIEQLEEELS